MGTMPSRRRAPGPPGLPLLGNLIPFRRDVLGLLLESRRRYGDVVRYRLGPMLIHVVSHPDYVRHVLVTNQHNYNKQTRSSAMIRAISGDSLLVTSGDAWLRQRRLMQPLFQRQRLARFLPIMSAATEEMLQRWRPAVAGGEPLDVASEMMRLTYTIVGRSLFGADVGRDAEQVERAATVVLRHTYRRLERLFDWPLWLPTPGNLRFRRGLQALNAIVYSLIRRRSLDTHAPADLLTLLLCQRDEETGAGMSEEQVRNEVITLLLAGHETTANALTWTWYLLAKHPEAARRVRAEVSEVLGDRPPAFEDLARLPYTTAVIQESMRLYPPIWIVERHALADDSIGGFDIPAGSTVAYSPYVSHRHPDFWPSPEEFDPDRFGPAQSAQRPPYAYLPFGGGQRLCIGSHFALLEAQVIVALVARAYRLDLLPGFPVEPLPGITLRARHGLPMRLFAPSPTAGP